ncbi:MAG TPA: alpha-L-fucosidase [Blastocatellia bacterium]|nr:alpha-L-fucosidase [Blastocatellia bacterium]
MKTITRIQRCVIALTLACVAPQLLAQEKPPKTDQQNKPAIRPASKSQTREETGDKETVKGEHAGIGVETSKETASSHTRHPDAQWFPETGFGLFIHWGISSVRGMNISWPMIPGRALAKSKVSAEERERIIRESDYNLNGKPPQITPNEYWTMARDFNPQKYDPDKWLRAAREAGFTYVVLTTRHHEGFALWPSAYGDFDTKNFMGGRDLLKDYVAACRRNGLKVGFYYSPPDWYFDRDYMNFLYHGGAPANPEFPPLGPDLKPRTTKKPDAERIKHEAEYAALVKGQVEELLTRYGKIDLLWFDGKPPIPNGNNVITIERIRELQPGIVVNPRLHGHGDYITYERQLTTNKVATGWAEFCNTWTNSWPHVDGARFRANGYVLGQFVTSRSLGINYLLGVGPMATGEFTSEIYQNMAVVADWMKRNGQSVHGTKPLPAGESASVPATASASTRYLFILPQFRNGGAYDEDLLPPEEVTVTLKGIARPSAVRLLGDGATLKYEYSDKAITIQLPASRRTRLVDVVQVELSPVN